MGIASVFKLAGEVAKPAAAASDEALMVTHAISPANVVRADNGFKLQLPSPSLGVHKADNPNQNFGEIILAGKADILDAPGVKTYGADVYSRRVPEPHYSPIEDAPTPQLVRNRLKEVVYPAEHGMEEQRFYERVVESQEYTPENILDYLNSVPDRNTEGVAVDGSEALSPSTFPGVLAALTPELAGKAGAAAERARFVSKESPEHTDLKTRFILMRNEHGDATTGDLLVKAGKYGSPEEFEASLRSAAAGASDGGTVPEPPVLKDMWQLAQDIKAAPVEYGEVRPRQLVEVRKGGHLDIAFVPQPYAGEEDAMFEAVKRLRARGVEVIRVPERFGGPAYAAAFKKALAEAKLAERGYTFGAGGAAVLTVAGLTDEGGVAHAADLPPSAQSHAVAPDSTPAASEGGTQASAQAGGETATTATPEGRLSFARLTEAAYRQHLQALTNRYTPGARGLSGSFRLPSTQPSTDGYDMTPNGMKQLRIDEGERLSVYRDSRGIATIGVGFNLEAPDNAATFKAVTGKTVEDAIAGRVVLTKAQSQALLDHEVKQAESEVPRLVPAFATLPKPVQDALVNFVFNVGMTTASDFKNTLAAVNRRDGKAAAAGIRKSAYYRQVGARGERVAKALEQLKP